MAAGSRVADAIRRIVRSEAANQPHIHAVQSRPQQTAAARSSHLR